MMLVFNKTHIKLITKNKTKQIPITLKFIGRYNTRPLSYRIGIGKDLKLYCTDWRGTRYITEEEL